MIPSNNNNNNNQPISTSSQSKSRSSSSSSSSLVPDIKSLLPKPSDLIYNITSKSPLLIGWNDETFRKLIEEQKLKKLKQIQKQVIVQQHTKSTIPTHIDDIRLPIEEHGFGLQKILSDVLKSYVYERSNFDDLKSDLKKIEDSGASLYSSKHNIENNTKDEKNGIFNIREMKLYQNLLNNVKYQRDVYIMGVEHAKKQYEYRQQITNHDLTSSTSSSASSSASSESVLAFPFGTNIHHHHHHKKKQFKPFTTYQEYLNDTPILPHQNKDTMASSQLTNIATWFIPSPVMHDSILSPVLWMIGEGGPLRKQVIQSSAALIPLSQPLLDKTMKDNLIWFLDNPNWRESIKGSTRNLVGNNNNDNSNMNSNGGSGRFVTTKTVNYWDRY